MAMARTDTTPTTQREAHRFLLRVEQYIIHRVAIDNDPAALFIGEFVSRFETEMAHGAAEVNHGK